MKRERFRECSHGVVGGVCGCVRTWPLCRVGGAYWNRRNRGRSVRHGRISVIRQAICCDICGAEKKQANHWFMAYDQNGELRVSGWNSRNRLQPGSNIFADRPVCTSWWTNSWPGPWWLAFSLASRRTPRWTSPSGEAMTACLRMQRIWTLNPQHGWLRRWPLLHPSCRRSGLRLSWSPCRKECEPGRPRLLPTSRPGMHRATGVLKRGTRERERSLRAMEWRPGIIARRRSDSWLNLLLAPAGTFYSVRALASNKARSPAWSRTGTLSSRALSSFEPASSPATT
jgi:hypothetical protein